MLTLGCADPLDSWATLIPGPVLLAFSPLWTKGDLFLLIFILAINAETFITPTNLEKAQPPWACHSRLLDF